MLWEVVQNYKIFIGRRVWQDIISRKKRKNCFRQSRLPLGEMAGGLIMQISSFFFGGGMDRTLWQIFLLVLTRTFLVKITFLWEIEIAIVTELQGFAATWGASNWTQPKEICKQRIFYYVVQVRRQGDSSQSMVSLWWLAQEALIQCISGRGREPRCCWFNWACLACQHTSYVLKMAENPAVDGDLGIVMNCR